MSSIVPTLIDAADPTSLAIILPEPLSQAVKQLPHALLIQDEVTLTTLVDPTDQQKRLKIQFWDEYELAIKQERVMQLSAVIFGVCTREYLLEFARPARNLAWLCCPRPGYKLRVAELIDKGLDCLEQIFNITVTEKNQVSVRGLQMQALRMLDMRKHGGYTQRMESKVLQKNVGHDEPPPAPDQDAPLNEDSIATLEAKLASLQTRVQTGKNQNGSLLNVSRQDREVGLPDQEAEIIDVTPGTGETC